MKAKPSAVSQAALQGSSFPQDSNGIASFSSRGPNRDFALKSDLAAAGTNVYMATQSVNGKGERLTSDFAVWQGKARG